MVAAGTTVLLGSGDTTRPAGTAGGSRLVEEIDGPGATEVLTLEELLTTAVYSVAAVIERWRDNYAGTETPEFPNHLGDAEQSSTASPSYSPPWHREKGSQHRAADLGCRNDSVKASAP
ncbi:hypothetical protein [Nocardia cyriacigeorgica]|uniref:hypothetical protein n=1 Tax=Nocardia cyriacigeorgica TaxID=135487 RepID=UPI002457523B|nr:hypothetical protein [Nocardia cyriacigeorgica]